MAQTHHNINTYYHIHAHCYKQRRRGRRSLTHGQEGEGFGAAEAADRGRGSTKIARVSCSTPAAPRKGERELRLDQTDGAMAMAVHWAWPVQGRRGVWDFGTRLLPRRGEGARVVVVRGGDCHGSDIDGGR